MAHTGNSLGGPTPKDDKWKHRRRFMLATVVFCKLVVIYCLARELEGSVAETAVTMAFMIIGTTVSSYVFGATWQDINVKDWAPNKGPSDPLMYDPYAPGFDARASMNGG